MVKFRNDYYFKIQTFTSSFRSFLGYSFSPALAAGSSQLKRSFVTRSSEKKKLHTQSNRIVRKGEYTTQEYTNVDKKVESEDRLIIYDELSLRDLAISEPLTAYIRPSTSRDGFQGLAAAIPPTNRCFSREPCYDTAAFPAPPRFRSRW